MRFRALLCAVAIGALLVAAGGGAALSAAQAVRPQALPPGKPAAPQADLLTKYCVSCHNDKLKTAGLTLQELEFSDVPAHAQVWEKVMRKVRSGEMPPATARARPDEATANALVAYLETTIDRAAAASPDPGRAPAHRL